MNLSPQVLLNAYASGIFPMAHDDGIYWYDPDPRAIIPLDHRFHVPRRLKQTYNRQPYTIKVNTAFTQVMDACAAPSQGRETTWIDQHIIQSYTALHRLGFAHSVEAWQDDELVGGLYGVAVRGLFAGESMFSIARDSSKLCLVALVERMRERGYVLLDTQFLTPHLTRFGAYEIPRRLYKYRLEQALQVEASFAQSERSE